MTSKQIYEAVAIELSKVQAPSLKLYDFNYFLNQAILQFVNKIYNIYDINQQTTDDLRVLKSTATLKPEPALPTGNKAIDYLRGTTYFVEVPDDYLHLLNCICLFNVNKKNQCWDEGDVMVVGATKLLSDNWSEIINDVYNKPSKKHPYYYIHNQNDIYIENGQLTDRNSKLPTNINSQSASYKSENSTDNLHTLTTDDDLNQIVTVNAKSNFKRTFDFDGNEEDCVNKPSGSRFANSSKVKIEIRCGKDKSNIFDLSAVQIDYIKAPQYVKLTQEQLDSEIDISQIMEFPEYVNQEIINELVNLIMLKTNNPSLQAHMQITQSIARPTGQ